MSEQPHPSSALLFPTLYPKQRAFVEDPARYTVCFASTKSGKSVGLLCWILGRAWEIGKPGRDFHWIAPAYPVAKIMFGRMQRWLRRADSDRDIWRSNESELYIELVNGARIHFKGGDRPDLLYGPDSWGVVIDEGTRVREECFFAARSMVTKTQGPIKIVGNMKGRKNWMYRLYQRGLTGDGDISCHLLDAYDAVEGGVIAAEEVEDARRALPEQVFRELYLASPSDDAGNPFGLDHIASCVAPLSDAPPVAWGWDLAKGERPEGDWTVGIALDERGDVCRFERWQAPWRDTIRRILGATGQVPACVDSTGAGDPILEHLQAEVPGVFEGYLFSQASKQKLMEGLALAIGKTDVRYPDGVITSELESFEYEYTRTGVRYMAAGGMHDDCVCALALAVNHSTAQNRSAYPFSRYLNDSEFRARVLGPERAVAPPKETDEERIARRQAAYYGAAAQEGHPEGAREKGQAVEWRPSDTHAQEEDEPLDPDDTRAVPADPADEVRRRYLERVMADESRWKPTRWD
jgi:hypothetical protein